MASLTVMTGSHHQSIVFSLGMQHVE